MDKSPDWTHYWSQQGFAPLERENMFAKFLDAVVTQENAKQKTAIEIGCFPGRFIDYIGEKGYIISGIDIIESTPLLKEWLKNRNRTVGEFVSSTFEQYLSAYSGSGFDIVCSFGFIEHFIDFCKIIFHHLRLCKKGGLVIIGAPNFATPVQRALHKVLDAQNLSDHVLEAMYPRVWRTFAAGLGMKIRYAGPVGKFDFWFEGQPASQNIHKLRHWIRGAVPYFRNLGGHFNEEEAGYSFLVAEKTSDAPQFFNEISDISISCQEIAQDISTRDELLARQYIDIIRNII